MFRFSLYCSRCSCLVTYVLMIGGLVSGCSNPNSSVPSSASEVIEVPDEEVDDAPKSGSVARVDKSIAVERFIGVGGPQCDHDWSGDEMLQAAQILTHYARVDSGYLPRKDSEQSGKIFKQLTANESFALISDVSVSLDTRSSELIKYTDANSRIIEMYVAAYDRSVVGDAEMVDLAGRHIKILAATARLKDETLSTLSVDDPTYSTRELGAQLLLAANDKSVVSMLQLLTNAREPRVPELKRLIGFMRESFPDILPHLSVRGRSEVLSRLREFQDNPGMQLLQPELDAMVAIAEEAVKSNAVQGPAQP